MIVFMKPVNFFLTQVICPDCGQVVTLTAAKEVTCKCCNALMYPEMAYMSHRIFFRQQYYNEKST
jgi:hypothetical protein